MRLVVLKSQSNRMAVWMCREKAVAAAAVVACCKRKGGTRAHGCDQYYCARLLVTCVRCLRVCVPDPTFVRHWIFSFLLSN
jgi:hypothetical protein